MGTTAPAAELLASAKNAVVLRSGGGNGPKRSSTGVSLEWEEEDLVVVAVVFHVLEEMEGEHSSRKNDNDESDEDEKEEAEEVVGVGVGGRATPFSGLPEGVLLLRGARSVFVRFFPSAFSA